MLKIQKPITITANPSILKHGDSFAQRIAGNYQIMSAGINADEMLHFISTPPEIYFAENEGLNSFVDIRSTYNNKQTNVEIVNNILNRILVSDTYKLTYQDQIFINNVLQKLGVTDLKTFYSQIKNMRQETNNIEELIDIYVSNSDILHEIKENYQNNQKIQNNYIEPKDKENVTMQLYEKIFKRLQTSDIYNEVSNFVSNTHISKNYIRLEEMQVSEQYITAKNMQLNQIKNSIMADKQEFTYNRINTYELGDINEQNINRNYIVNEFVQAVLLNAISQMYHMRFSELSKNDNNWLNLSSVIHNVTERTMQRFENYHNNISVTRDEADSYVNNINNYFQKEIEILNSLIQNNKADIKYTEYNTEKNAQIIKNNSIKNEELLKHTYENLNNINLEEIRNDESTIQQINEHYETGLNELINDTHYSNTLVVQDHEKSLPDVEYIYNMSAEEILKQQLDIINQQNVEKYQQLQQLEVKNEKNGNLKINKAKAKQDALRAITNSREVINEYLTAKEKITKQELVKQETLEKIYDTDTIRIFEILEKINRNEIVTNLPVITEDKAFEQLKHDAKFYNTEVYETITDINKNINKNIERINNITTQNNQQIIKNEYLNVQNQELIQDVESQIIKSKSRANRVNIIRHEDLKEIVQTELFHKQTETNISEEMLEEIKNINRSVNEDTQSITETINSSNTIREIVNNHVNEIRLQQNEDISRIVTQNVREQIGSLAEQVYGKLEKRMDTERRRRGI